jgi:hypothetical protein
MRCCDKSRYPLEVSSNVMILLDFAGTMRSCLMVERMHLPTAAGIYHLPEIVR